MNVGGNELFAGNPDLKNGKEEIDIDAQTREFGCTAPRGGSSHGKEVIQDKDVEVGPSILV